jgi:hypothetical protein
MTPDRRFLILATFLLLILALGSAYAVEMPVKIGKAAVEPRAGVAEALRIFQFFRKIFVVFCHF